MKALTDLFRPRTPQDDGMAVLASALALSAFGLVCLYSLPEASVMRQAACAALGIVACLVIARVPLERLRAAAGPLLVVTGGLLLIALLFAKPVANTQRWLALPLVGRFQPSELAKIAVVLFAAHRLTGSRDAANHPLRAGWPIGVICLLVLLAPDFGTAVFLAAIASMMFLIGGARLGRMLGLVVCVLPLLLIAVSKYPHVRERLRFFGGEKNYQQLQAEIALGSGGMFGSGLGAGLQKQGYVPAVETDFILANIGEELGFLGVTAIIALFSLVLIHGVRVALAAARQNRFAFHIAAGATFVIVFQAVLNIAVVTGVAPTKGIPLPFLSQGGSNLIVMLVAVGLVVNVARNLEARR